MPPPSTLQIKRLGYRPDLPDHRDHFYNVSAPSTLPPIVDLRPKCPPVYDQGEIGSCHDDQTEVLTENGWKLFSDVALGEELATVDPQTSKLYFEKPRRLIALDYDGDMHYGTHQSLDFAVTAAHKLLVRKWDQKAKTLSEEYNLVAAKDLGWYAGFMTQLDFDDTYGTYTNADEYTLCGIEHKLKVQRTDHVVPMSAWMQFLGIYIAEGTVLLNDRYKIQLAAFKPREKDFIRELLKTLNLSYCELDDRFTITNKRLYTEMVSLGLCGVKAPQKFVPDLVFNVKKQYINDFLHGHFMGDGCEGKDGRISHYTSSKRLADEIQLLYLLTGRWSSIYCRPPRQSIMNDGRVIQGNYPEHQICAWKSDALSIDRKGNIEVKNYKGKVYCAEVPTYHTLVTRRNNKILVSGNCTSQALAGLIHYNEIQEGHKETYNPSRLFIYYNERQLEGTVEVDAGASLRDGIRSLAYWGVPLEKDWPYDVSKFSVRPPDKVYKAARMEVVKEYSRIVQKIADLRTCVHEEHPIAVGISVYEGFMGDVVKNTGKVNMPAYHERCLGGHAVLIVGYDDTVSRFIVRNSWGPKWGQAGYFTLPYEYILNPDLCGDMWTVRMNAK